MSEKTLDPFEFRISYVHDDGCHVVGLRRYDKQVIFCNVAFADKSCIGERVAIQTARAILAVDCPPRFYKAYGILDPYEHGWKFLKLIPGTVVFSENPPFKEIPLAKAEVRQNVLDSVVKDSVWTNGKNTWVIQDTHLERLAGQERLRVWVTDKDGKRGQALYADSLVGAYKKIARNS
jgi:hypothetical protein